VPLTDATALAREQALRAALDLHRASLDRPGTIGDAEDAVRATAETFTAWLLGTTRIRLTRSPITSQTTGQPAGQAPEGATVQIHDDETFTLTVNTRDARGFETADTIDWAVDNGDVLSLQISDDSRSCRVVAGTPGSAVVTVTDTAIDPQLSATEAVDVVPGGTATITLTEGPVEKQ
jgi:hypothetical protein